MATRSWNKVELMGNLTRDPELKYTPQGTAVTTFSIATNRVYTSSDGEKKEEADFHRCVAWGKLAELCQQLLKKGNRVFVSGRLQNRSWEGQDGQTKYMTEVVVEDMILVTSRGNDEYSSSDTSFSSSSKGSTQAVEDVSPLPADEDVASEEKPKKEEEKPTPKEDPGDLDDLPF